MRTSLIASALLMAPLSTAGAQSTPATQKERSKMLVHVTQGY